MAVTNRGTKRVCIVEPKVYVGTNNRYAARLMQDKKRVFRVNGKPLTQDFQVIPVVTI